MFDDILKKPAGPKRKLNLISTDAEPTVGIGLSVLEEVEDVLTEMDFNMVNCVYCNADKEGKHDDLCYYHITRTKVIDAIDHAYANS